MSDTRLIELFKDYGPRVQRVIQEVLRIEQEYITDPLRPNGITTKEIKQKIARAIEEAIRDEN